MLLYKLYIELGRKEATDEVEFEFVHAPAFERKKQKRSIISIAVRGDNMPVYAFNKSQITEGILKTEVPSVFTKIIGGGTPSLSILIALDHKHTICSEPEYELGLDGIWRIGRDGDPDFLKYIWDHSCGGVVGIPSDEVERFAELYEKYGFDFMTAHIKRARKSVSGWWCVIL